MIANNRTSYKENTLIAFAPPQISAEFPVHVMLHPLVIGAPVDSMRLSQSWEKKAKSQLAANHFAWCYFKSYSIPIQRQYNLSAYPLD